MNDNGFVQEFDKQKDMTISRCRDIQIVGVASAVSNNWQSLENAAAEAELDTDFNVEKFKKNTGVTGRYVAGQYQTASDFCYTAAVAILDKYNIKREDVGILLFISQFPDYPIPATACVLHKRLGLTQGCIAFDINLGCSGFVYGLNVASSLLQTSNKKYALMLCGDTSVKNKSRGRKKMEGSHSILFLFGDSGTAALLEKKERNSLTIVSCTDGEGFNAIMMPEYSWRHPWSNAPRFIDDMRVFNFSISAAPKMLKEYMKLMSTKPEEYDKLVLHQANTFIMSTVAKRAGFQPEQVLSSIEVFANTSSASIPNTLVHEYGGKSGTERLKFLCCGFGVGLSWAVVELNLAPDQILPLIHTDEWFDDGLPEE